MNIVYRHCQGRRRLSIKGWCGNWVNHEIKKGGEFAILTHIIQNEILRLWNGNHRKKYANYCDR